MASDYPSQTAGAQRVATGPPEEPSLGDLLSRLTAETTDLVKAEIRLARAEVTQDVKRGAKGGGMIGGAAFAGYMAILMLSFAAAWGLAQAVPAGVAFLIVGAVYVIVAAALGVVGRRQLEGFRPVPDRTVETLKEDVRWLKN